MEGLPAICVNLFYLDLFIGLKRVVFCKICSCNDNSFYCDVEFILLNLNVVEKKIFLVIHKLINWLKNILNILTKMPSGS